MGVAPSLVTRILTTNAPLPTTTIPPAPKPVNIVASGDTLLSRQKARNLAGAHKVNVGHILDVVSEQNGIRALFLENPLPGRSRLVEAYVGVCHVADELEAHVAQSGK